jgi:hypothetical protein
MTATSGTMITGTPLLLFLTLALIAATAFTYIKVRDRVRELNAEPADKKAVRRRIVAHLQALIVLTTLSLGAIALLIGTLLFGATD